MSTLIGIFTSAYSAATAALGGAVPAAAILDASAAAITDASASAITDGS